MKRINDRIIDLSDIKENDLDKTSSFTDLMTKSERKMRKLEKEKGIDVSNSSNNDIEDMIVEKKKSTSDLTKELKNINDKEKKIDKKDIEENISKTQILELTRQMKFNFEVTKEENFEKKKRGISVLNIIGEINLLCIGYYIYLLIFTNYQDEQQNYLITGGLIILLVLLFGLSVITNKKASKFFNILNILAIIGFVAFNVFTLLD